LNTIRSFLAKVRKALEEHVRVAASAALWPKSDARFTCSSKPQRMAENFVGKGVTTF
jgi:tRNA U38,U39,U40 pseudouridine synthase TruA